MYICINKSIPLYMYEFIKLFIYAYMYICVYA